MENKFKESRLIEQVMVIGEGQKMPGAFIVPDFDALQIWCKNHNIKYSSNEEMVEKKEVINKYQEEIDHYNKQFASFEG